MDDIYATRCTLLARAQNQHDEQAWSELFELYKRYIYVIIRSMNISPSDADDILQIVTVQVWKKLPEFEYRAGQSKFRSWLSTVTRNAVLVFLRTERSSAAKHSAARQEAAISYLDSIIVPDVEVLEEREWIRFITNTAMNNIQKHFSDKALKAFDAFSRGKTVTEISQQIEMGENSVYKYIQRIRKRLSEEISILKRDLDL